MQQINFTVSRVTVICSRHGPDCIVIDTILPSPYNPEFSTQPLSLEFQATAGNGVKYATETLGLIVDEVIGPSNNFVPKFSRD